MNDLRFAFRQLFKSPAFSGIAIATLALGIGLNTSMFSLLNILLLRPLPFPERDQLVRVYRTSTQEPRGAHNALAFLELQRQTAGTLRVAAFRTWGYTLTQPGHSPENLNALRVSADFFPLLGLQPELGRYFAPEEDQPGNQVIVLSHAIWQSQFGSDPTIVGRTIAIDGQPTTVIGVMPEKFSNLLLWGPSDAFRPLGLTEAEKAAKGETGLNIIGRAASGLNLHRLNAQLGATASQLAAMRPREQSEDGLRAVSLQDATLPPGTGAAFVLFLCLTGVVLLIVCVNLASLHLARAFARTREFAIRAALGANRASLIRPLLLESVLLSLAGGLLGLLVAQWGNDWFTKRMADVLPVMITINFDWRVFAFALGAALIAGAVFGLVPALLSARVNVNETLKSGARGSTGDRSHHFFRGALIVTQFAAVLVQLSCTGFLIRGLGQLTQRDPGWTTAGVTHAILNLPPTRYASSEQSLGFMAQLEERVRALPDVESVTTSWSAPLYQYLATRSFVVEGREPPPPGKEPVAFVNAVSPGYLHTLKIRLASGRDFTAADRMGAAPVVMINESLARSLFPNQDPLGQHLVNGEGASRVSAEIVGVFSDVGMAGNPGALTTPFQVFRPLAQEPWNYFAVLVRSRSGAPLTEPLRQILTQLDPNVPIQLLSTADHLAKTSTRGLETIATVFAGFGVLGLFLAALGLYGVIARLVLQRTAEIGVRIALGAQVADILRLMMGTGLRLALIGAALGLLGSLGANLVISAFFAGRAGVDYTTIGITTGLLVVVALAATYLPARRATKVDPITALRTE